MSCWLLQLCRNQSLLFPTCRMNWRCNECYLYSKFLSESCHSSCWYWLLHQFICQSKYFSLLILKKIFQGHFCANAMYFAWYDTKQNTSTGSKLALCKLHIAKICKAYLAMLVSNCTNGDMMTMLLCWCYSCHYSDV